MSDKMGVEFGASAGYIGDDYAGGEGGLMDGNITAGLSYSVNDAIGLSAMIGYTTNLDDEVLPDQDVDTYGGISVSCAL